MGIDLVWQPSASDLPSQTASSAEAPKIKSDPRISDQKRKRTSDVWNHYTKVIDGPLTKAICKNCSSTLSAQSTSGTNHLWRHLNRCKNQPGQALLPVPSRISPELRAKKFKQDLTRESLVQMVIALELPFRTVEDQMFLNFASALQPQFRMLDGATLEQECVNLYRKKKVLSIQTLKDYQLGKIALNTELWTSQTSTIFLKLVSHHIDQNWKLIKKSLGFKVLPEPITEVGIAHCLLETLEEWGITEKCGSITTAGSNRNNLAINRIRRVLNERGVLEPAGYYFHVHCAAHLINQIAQEAFQSLLETTLPKIRNSIKFYLITSSEFRQKSFKEAVDSFGLGLLKIPTLDLGSRWDTTYLMISDIIPFQLVFEHLRALDPEYLDCPGPVEWMHLKTLQDSLEVFYEALSSFCGHDLPTVNRSYMNMKKIEKYLAQAAEHSTNDHSINLIRPMINTFQKYWSDMKELFEIALVLDPRFKFQYLRFSLIKQYGAEVAEGQMSILKSRLYTIFQSYLPGNSTNESLGFHPTTESTKPKSHESIVPDDDINEFQKYLAGTTMIQTPYGSRTAELDLYLQEPVVRAQDCIGFDVLSWWKVNELRFPRLVSFVRNILMVPMISTSSESTFSVGGSRILNDFQSGLEPECLEALICTRDWLQEENQNSTGT